MSAREDRAAERHAFDVAESRRRNEERNAGRDDSTRCPSVHYFGGNHCQHEAGHHGPHIAEYQNADGTIWPGKYRIWEHDVTTPRCNQRDVTAQEYKAWRETHTDARP